MIERILSAAIKLGLAILFVVIAWPFLFTIANDGVRP